MHTSKIPTSPSVSKNKLTYSSQKWKAHCTLAPKHRSITYDREKGGMTWAWADHNEFLTWLVAEQTEKAIELIVNQTEKSEGPIWQECRMYWCRREYSGGKSMYQKINQWERMIPLKKTGCQCRLTIK